MNLNRTILLVLFASLVFVPAQAQDSALNQGIIQFCQEHMGQKVGDGECFALANVALHQAGGTRSFRDNPANGDYVWGALVLSMEGTGSAQASSGSLESVQAGDIIQFRDCRFQHKKSWVSFGHHTAVIAQVGNDGKEWKIYQENFGGKKIVTTLTLHPKELTKGWFRVYQPMKKGK
jgi:hypothetical protein